MLSAGGCEKEIKRRVALTYGWLVYKRFGKAMKLMSSPNVASFMLVYSVYFYMRLDTSEGVQRLDAFSVQYY